MLRELNAETLLLTVISRCLKYG